MAKFCGNCGAPLDYDARVCGQCGTPVEGKEKLRVKDPEKVRKTKKIMKIVIIIGVLSLVLFGTLKVAYNLTGVRGLTRKVMNAYKDYDIETLALLSSDMYYYEAPYSDISTAEEYFTRVVGENHDYYENIMGNNYKIKYKILDQYDFSDRKQEKTLERIKESKPEFDPSIIEKFTAVNVELTLDNGGKPIKKKITVIISKEGKNLRLLDINDQW